MLKINPKRRMMVYGKTQSGKSYWVRTWLKSVNAYLIWDVKKQYSEFGVVVDSVNELVLAVRSGAERIVFQPMDLSVFDSLCGFIVDNMRGFLFVVEEVQLVTSPNFTPPKFMHIISVLEEEGVGVIGVSQRPSQVSTVLRGNCSYVVSFRLNEDIDKKAVSCISDNDLGVLREFEFLFYDDSKYDNPISKHKSPTVKAF